MKIRIIKLLAILAILILVSFATLSCSGAKYEIRVYKIPTYLEYYKEGRTKDYLIKEYLQGREFKTYKAKEIIDFDNTSVRFIDEDGEEQFMSADKVEVKRIY